MQDTVGVAVVQALDELECEFLAQFDQLCFYVALRVDD